MTETITLPPGQHRIHGFPRFGLHLDHPAPAVPVDPVLAIGGAVTKPFAVPLGDLATLPRRELTADFHCVAGWSASDLHWEGVPFQAFYRAIIEPAVRPGATITHVEFAGLDGYRVAITLEDAMADDVLIAERLDGRRLDGDHGAPARLVSPKQYGFVNAKHLCRIEVHTSEPRDSYDGHLAAKVFVRLFHRHPRARVWEEERHRYLPAWSIRLLGRALMSPVAYLSSRRTSRGSL
jgi:DMSO/TMAO reductase YedYZ molybdopterin-dependent catalytic subunit